MLLSVLSLVKYPKRKILPFAILLLLFLVAIYLRSRWPENTSLFTDEEDLPVIAISKDNRYVATFNQDYQIVLFDRNERCVNTIGEKPAIDESLKGFLIFSPDGKQLIAGGSHPDQMNLTNERDPRNGSSISIWDIQTGQRVRGIVRGDAFGPAAALFPDGCTLAYRGSRGSITFCNVQSGKLTGSISAPNAGAQLMSLAVSDDGKKLGAAYFYADGGGGLMMCDAQSRKVLWSKGLGEGQYHRMNIDVSSLAFSPDGTIVAVAGYNNGLDLFDAKTGRCIRSIDNPVPSDNYHLCSQTVDFSSDGKLVASGLYSVKIWNVGNGKLRGQIPGFGAVKFSSEGEFLATYTSTPATAPVCTVTLWKNY